MRGVLMLSAGLIFLILSPFLIDSIHDARVASIEQSFAAVTTAAGVNSANVTLTQSIFGDTHSNVTGITSNSTLDVPTAANYTAASQVVEVGGLVASATRTLVLTHEIANQDLAELPSVSGLLLTATLLYFLALFGLIGGAIYSFFRP